MKTNFFRSLLVAVFALIGMVAANAQVKNGGELELNKAYDIPAFVDFLGYYNVTADGTLKITSNNSGVQPHAYTDETRTAEYPSTGGVVGNSNYIQFTVSKGDVVWIGSFFPLDNATFTLTFLGTGQMETMKLVNSSPAQEKRFDVSNSGGQVALLFNIPVSCSKANVVYGGQSYAAEIRIGGANPNIMSVVIKEVITSLLDDGKAVGGEPFEVHLSGLCEAGNTSNKYNGTGTLSLSYLMPARQPHIVNDELKTGTLLSWFSPNKEAGVYSITFDQPIAPAKPNPLNPAIGYAVLSQGNIEASEEPGVYYIEYIPYTLSEDGLTVTVDFRGVQRNKQSTLPNYVPNEQRGESELNSFVLKLEGLKGVNGEYAYTTAAGSVGSFTYTLPWTDLSVEEAYQVNAELTPSEGTIKAGDVIEIWMDKPENITFTDITIGGKKAAYTVEDDPDEGVIYLVTVPQLTQNGETQLVFTDLEFIDGIDHNHILTATYQFEGATPDEPVPGDIDGDGKVTINDITELIYIYLNQAE